MSQKSKDEDYFLQRDRAQAAGSKLPGNRNAGLKGRSENQPSAMSAPEEERMDGRREEGALLLSLQHNLSSSIPTVL